MSYGYGNPFESRCALCGKNLGLFGPEWELCDECSKIKFESKEKKERKMKKN
jgi:hypothetical protein